MTISEIQPHDFFWDIQTVPIKVKPDQKVWLIRSLVIEHSLELIHKAENSLSVTGLYSIDKLSPSTGYIGNRPYD